MNKLKFCFLDMDGVLVDFVGGVCAAHNRETPYLSPNSYGIFEMETVWGISTDEFWTPTQFDGFWSNLDKTPEADNLVELACSKFGTENVCILTSPSDDYRCIPEKQEWIAKHYPKLQRQMLFGSAKRFLAGPDRLMIDDRDKNIENFRKAGGIGITMPRLWNCEWALSNSSFDAVQEALDYVTVQSELKNG